jgi:hypothetical protein
MPSWREEEQWDGSELDASRGVSDADRSRRDDLGVPTISRFLEIVIAMFYDDHEPAHFRCSGSLGGEFASW